jgi:predicted RND superfamily exporter protein
MHRLTALCVRHPWVTLLLAVAAIAAAARSSRYTQLDLGLGVTLGADHPVVRDFDAFLERFGGGYPVLIAYECERPEVCAGALDAAALEMADAVSHQLLRSTWFPSISSLGFMSAVAISAATLADLIILPALIATFAVARAPVAGLGGRSSPAAFPRTDPRSHPSRTGGPS